MPQGKISTRVRTQFREALTAFVLGQITDLFDAEGVVPGTPAREWTGQRRTLVEEYYAGVDWNSATDTHKVLRVYESVLREVSPESRQSLLGYLRMDGFEVTEVGEIHHLARARLLDISLSDAADEAAIREHLDRIERSIDTDPSGAIGAAKELVETTCKLVLRRTSRPIEENCKFPKLVSEASKVLSLHTTLVAPDARGVKTILGLMTNLAGLAVGVDEIRNLYGTGHGRDRKVAGLRPRHAHLAVGAAAVYCRMMLDTLEDPAAPWRALPKTA
jgi:hypothetical protein